MHNTFLPEAMNESLHTVPVEKIICVGDGIGVNVLKAVGVPEAEAVLVELGLGITTMIADGIGVFDGDGKDVGTTGVDSAGTEEGEGVGTTMVDVTGVGA